MNTDPFEKKLQEQQIRQIPPEWRDQLLAAAANRDGLQTRPTNTSARLSEQRERSGGVVDVWSRIAACFWPSPRAWAGLAAVWVAIGLCNFAGPGDNAHAPGASASAAPAMFRTIQEQERLLAELTRSSEIEPAKPSTASPPGPRSELRKHFPA